MGQRAVCMRDTTFKRHLKVIEKFKEAMDDDITYCEAIELVADLMGYSPRTVRDIINRPQENSHIKCQVIVTKVTSA